MTPSTYLGPSPRLLHPGLVASAATLLIATLATDYLYWDTLLFQYGNFSGWLLAGGLLLALFAALALVVDLFRGSLGRVAWWRFGGLAVAALLGVLNAFVHSRDAYAAVLPEGIILSATVTVILLAVGLGGGWSLAARPNASLAHDRDTRP